jgi:hypothetical protein
MGFFPRCYLRQVHLDLSQSTHSICNEVMAWDAKRHKVSAIPPGLARNRIAICTESIISLSTVVDVVDL